MEKKKAVKRYKDEHFFSFSNDSRIVKLIEKNILSFQQKFDNKAFLHWYSKFGVEEDELSDALEMNYRIIDSYKENMSL